MRLRVCLGILLAGFLGRTVADGINGNSMGLDIATPGMPPEAVEEEVGHRLGPESTLEDDTVEINRTRYRLNNPSVRNLPGTTASSYLARRRSIQIVTL